VEHPGSRDAPPGAAAMSSPASQKSETDGPWGPRALYFGTRRAVHGTSEPGRIGQSASFGCFHSWNNDIVELYDRVLLNERVVVVN
jgi:lipoprotein-anchoring transpeptidase ErfK/SrfK